MNDQFSQLYDMYVLQVSEQPVGDYAPISARLVTARSFLRSTYDMGLVYDKSAFEAQMSAGVDPYQHAHRLASHLPKGTYYLKDRTSVFYDPVQQSGGVKVTYSRSFNETGGVELDDCREAVIRAYNPETGAIEFQFEDTGEVVQDTISTRQLWNQNRPDEPVNWEVFTTINPY